MSQTPDFRGSDLFDVQACPSQEAKHIEQGVKSR
jgi:hypothetical protein